MKTIYKEEVKMKTIYKEEVKMKTIYKNIHKVIPITLILMVLVVFTACAPKEVTIQGYEPSVDISELELDKSQSPAIVYMRPGAAGFEAYNRFIIDPVRIIYSDPRMKELSPEQVGRMQEYLQNAMIKELRDAGYEVGTKSQAETMRLTFTITGLQAPSAAANVTVAVAPIAVSVGEVTVEWVLRDALTNRIDGVAVTRARGARGFNPNPWSTWADVEKTFDSWAKGLRETIDKAHNK